MHKAANSLGMLKEIAVTFMDNVKEESHKLWMNIYVSFQSYKVYFSLPFEFS